MPLTLKITEEYWDSEKQEFVYPELGTLVLEHSLISISKWEGKWHKAYLEESVKKTNEETLDYIRCMSIKGEPSDAVLSGLTKEDVDKIINYINDPMTATTFKKEPGKTNNNITNFVTSELIYAKMVMYGVPVEFEKWHLNRLLTLIKVLDEQNKEPKKHSERELISNYAKIREANRARFKAKGSYR